MISFLTALSTPDDLAKMNICKIEVIQHDANSVLVDLPHGWIVNIDDASGRTTYFDEQNIEQFSHNQSRFEWTNAVNA